MDLSVDAQKETFNFHLTLKRIHDHLESRDVKSMKFLCLDFIPPQQQEKIKSALDLFQELQRRRKISQPDNVMFLGELLYCVHQHRLLEMLLCSADEIRRIVDEGRGQLHPCRILFFHICESITDEQLSKIRYLCPQIPRAAQEKVKDPLDLIVQLERLNLVKATKLGFLREILLQSDLDHLVSAIDTFTANGKLSFDYLSSTSVFSSSVSTQPACPGENLGNLCTGLQHTHISSLRTHGGNQTTAAACYAVQETPLVHASALQPTEGRPLSIQVDAATDVSEDLRYYNMTRRPRGICLIINNEKFYSEDATAKSLKNRNGTEIDCKLLEPFFGENLHFKVERYDNLSSKEMLDLLKKYAAEDHSNYDCFACFVLSHGTDGAVYGVNGKAVQLKHITSCFKPSRCRSLGGKPKLFFIQACQGDLKQSAFDIEADGPDVEGVVPQRESISDEADILVSLATVPGYASYRSKSKGTWFITTLVDVMKRYVKSEDLLGILTEVNCRLCNEEAIKKELDGKKVYKQVAMPMSTLRKKVKFS